MRLGPTTAALFLATLLLGAIHPHVRDCREDGPAPSGTAYHASAEAGASHPDCPSCQLFTVTRDLLPDGAADAPQPARYAGPAASDPVAAISRVPENLSGRGPPSGIS